MIHHRRLSLLAPNRLPRETWLIQSERRGTWLDNRCPGSAERPRPAAISRPGRRGSRHDGSTHFCKASSCVPLINRLSSINDE
jgi:hypothetical protein